MERRLEKAIDKLIKDVDKARWKNKKEVKKDRPDADEVHNDGFYIIDISGAHRVMALIEYQPEEPEKDENGEEIDEGIVQIHWVDDHDAYERTFKNDKKVIKTWLRKKGLI